MQQGHDDVEKSEGEQSKRPNLWIRLRSWGNSIVDLAAYVGQRLRQVFGGKVDPRKQALRVIVLGAVVVITVGAVLMYFEQQVNRLEEEMQGFSSLDTTGPDQVVFGEMTQEPEQGFSIGGVELGLSEEELVGHMALQQEETAAALARVGDRLPAAPDSLSEDALGALNLSKLTWPVQGTVKTGYGWWRHPLYRDWRMHTGIAVTTPVGSTVHAALPGRVVDVYHDNYLRTVVVVEHGGQVRTLYGNLQEVAVTLGASVAQGRVLGRAASAMQEPSVGEVYFEVRHHNEAIDPMPYLR